MNEKYLFYGGGLMILYGLLVPSDVFRAAGLMLVIIGGAVLLKKD